MAGIIDAQRQEYQRAYRLSHKAEKKANALAYRLTHPDDNKQRCRSYYTAHKQESDDRRKEYYIAHREEQKAKNRAYYQSWKVEGLKALKQQRRESPEKSRAAAMKWHDAHPVEARELKLRYKARKKTAFIERVSIEEVHRRDKGICQICYNPVTATSCSLDHIIPLSRGGVHATWNVQATHLRCNIKRGAGRIPSQCRLAL